MIWEKWQEKLEPLRASIDKALKKAWEEWEIPREAESSWPDAARKDHAAWREARIARQKEIDASIAAKAEFEYLYDRPYPDKSRVRVAGPFTVESLSPHRVLGVDEDDELIGGEFGTVQRSDLVAAAREAADAGKIRVKVKGVDVFKPQTDEVMKVFRV